MGDFPEQIGEGGVDDEIMLDSDLSGFLRKWVATTERTWDEYASCKSVPPEFFFEEDADLHGVCGQCSVKVECLDDALKFKDEGWRGDMSEDDRRKLQMRRFKYNRFFHADLRKAFPEDAQ